jgi:hypothetical protein
MTTIDGVASPRSSAARATACSTVYARAQVLLRDQRRTCDHIRVHGPEDSGGTAMADVSDGVELASWDAALGGGRTAQIRSAEASSAGSR